MMTPLDLMILTSGFGIVGLYLYFVSRFIPKADEETAVPRSVQKAIFYQ